jgi:hypothetical protein
MRAAPVTNELSAADCLVFDGFVAKWQSILNLADWRIERAGKRSAKNMAEVVFDDGARLASYRVGVSFGDTPVTPASLESTALHEVLHVLLHDMLEADGGALEGAEHRVINILEKLLLKGTYAAHPD